MDNNEDEEASYIDYETFLAPDFSPTAFANTLVLATNNANDTPLDLSTPLSRVLFDIQEIDSHIDLLTTRSAIPLLAHTKEQTEASSRVVGEIDAQVKSLNDSYKQLEKEVIQKHAEADEVRQVASRLWEALRLGRSLGRCLQLGRQLEVQHAEISSSPSSTSASASARKEDHRALVRCAYTILSLREILEHKGPDEEGYGLDKVGTIRTLQDSIVAPIEKSVRETAERAVREFSMAASATFAQVEETKARTVSALTALYLISPTALAKNEKWVPSAMLLALEVYLRSAVQSSVASLARSLAALPSLERTLTEASARCQNVAALEVLLEATKAPAHPLRASLSQSATAAVTAAEKGNLLQPLLAYLETGSLASYFWRSVASNLAPRVQDIVNRGGVSARTLKTNRNSVGDAIRDCVIRGSQSPPSAALVAGSTAKGKLAEQGKGGSGGYEREVAVMVASVVNNIGR